MMVWNGNNQHLCVNQEVSIYIYGFFSLHEVSLALIAMAENPLEMQRQQKRRPGLGSGLHRSIFFALVVFCS